MNILITGGVGYIGSYAIKQLLENINHNLFTIDNLSTGSIKTIQTLNTLRSSKWCEKVYI